MIVSKPVASAWFEYLRTMNLTALEFLNHSMDSKRNIRKEFVMTMFSDYGLIIDPVSLSYNSTDQTGYTMFLLKYGVA